MSHERWHVIEKIQVEVAAAAALAIMYFGAWSLIRPVDVDEAFVFLPIGATGSLAALAGIVWALAVLCAILTVSARLEGAVLALLVGVAGCSFRTDPMRLLLNRFESDLPALMGPLAAEVAVLAVVLAVAVILIRLVRYGLGKVCPAWMRPATPTAAGAEPIEPAGVMDVLNLRRAFRSAMAKSRCGKGEPNAGEWAVSLAASFALTLLAGLLLMIVILPPGGGAERGQILFALAASFFVAAVVSAYLFPAGFSAPYLLAPLVLAVAVYVKTCFLTAAPPLTWSIASAWANILPIDWLSAGCGGAVGGYWLSCRLHEFKHITDDTES